MTALNTCIFLIYSIDLLTYLPHLATELGFVGYKSLVSMYSIPITEAYISTVQYHCSGVPSSLDHVPLPWLVPVLILSRGTTSRPSSY